MSSHKQKRASMRARPSRGVGGGEKNILQPMPIEVMPRVTTHITNHAIINPLTYGG